MNKLIRMTSPHVGMRENEGQRAVRTLRRGGRAHGGLHPKDRLLAEGEEPALGSHIVTPRLAYAHHGIYVGDGRVVHYAGLKRPLRRGSVEEISVARFAQGHTLWLRPHEGFRFAWQEVTCRARSRIGEDAYRLLTNNCEHFCEWCVRGEPRSEQVERVLGLPRRLARIASATVTGLLAVPPLRGVRS